MTLQELERRIRALPGVANDPLTVPALIVLALEYESDAWSVTMGAIIKAAEHAESTDH